MEEEYKRRLGSAVISIWGRLPQPIQSQIFEAAVPEHEAKLREELAVFLHNHHPRTEHT
jgi:hypothetical protein